MKKLFVEIYELQNFFSSFYIVANSHRENEFQDKINASVFSAIKSRIVFLSYDKVAGSITFKSNAKRMLDLIK